MKNCTITGVFGMRRDAYEYEKLRIKRLVETCPVEVFGMLNKKMNERGYQISIMTIEEDAKA